MSVLILHRSALPAWARSRSSTKAESLLEIVEIVVREHRVAFILAREQIELVLGAELRPVPRPTRDGPIVLSQVLSIHRLVAEVGGDRVDGRPPDDAARLGKRRKGGVVVKAAVTVRLREC